MVAWLWLVACGDPAGEPADPVQNVPSDPDPSSPDAPSDTPTWRADVEPIVTANCVACHRTGDVAPFALQTYDQAVTWAEPIRAAVETGTMPPWPPSDACLPLEGVRSLGPAEIATIGGALNEAAYVTGYEVEPGRRELVHHVILSTVSGDGVDQARALDADEAGPGYTCFGSSGVFGAETVGAWVPGVSGTTLPEGTGIRIEPESTVIVQVHYNTLSTPAPEPDLTSVGFRVADTVEKPAAALLVVDPGWLFGGMQIPAGEPSVVHDASFSGSSLARMASSIGADPGEPLVVHRVGLHMHLLGKRSVLTVERADGTEDCVMDIPDWDFHWQGSYALVEPLVLAPDDALRLACEWDNSAPGAVDASWGEGTSDEMCLVGLYVTR